MLNIKRFSLGAMRGYSYLVWREGSEAYLIDCGGEDIEEVDGFIKENNLELKGILLTHGHYDHIGGINKVVELYSDAKVYVGEKEQEFLKDPNLNLSNYIVQGVTFSYNGESKSLSEGDEVFGLRVLETPGHTRGSLCFFDDDSKSVFVGDTLFNNSHGRTDFPTGDYETLRKSLSKLVMELPEETKTYDGHTPTSSIKFERRYLKAQGII